MSNAVCNTVTQRVSYNVRLSSRPDQTRPESLYRPLVVVSGSTSIDLTVGVESPPEAWMDLDDLNLLDDGRVHCICTNCAPLRLPPLTEFVALCGARAVCRVGLVADCDGTECVDCLDVDVCPNCGTWF